jgi:hypothetical protein
MGMRQEKCKRCGKRRPCGGVHPWGLVDGATACYYCVGRAALEAEVLAALRARGPGVYVATDDLSAELGHARGTGFPAMLGWRLHWRPGSSELRNVLRRMADAGTVECVRTRVDAMVPSLFHDGQEHARAVVCSWSITAAGMPKVPSRWRGRIEESRPIAVRFHRRGACRGRRRARRRREAYLVILAVTSRTLGVFS